MEKVNLIAKPREVDGTRQARRLRRLGLIPGVVYGHGMKPLAIQVASRELLKALHTKAGENVLIDLDVESVKMKEKLCLIKDMQHNPITDEINHVDFAVISLTDKIKVKVHLVTTHADEAEGVKMGGILEMVHHEIEVECLPTAIPDKIEVDVKALKLGHSIHVRDLQMPQGVVCKLSADDVVVAIHAVKEEVVPVEGEQPTAPEVIEKGKKEEAEEGAEAVPAKAAAPAAKSAK